MKVSKTTSVMTHTTDSEIKAKFEGIRQLQPIRRLLEQMGYPQNGPTPSYTDNAAVSAIIDTERMTRRCRHIDIPIAYLHQEKMKSYEDKLIRTSRMLADFGTKPLVAYLHQRFKYWATGQKFLPVKGSKHYDALKMEYYEISFIDILRSCGYKAGNE